MTVRDRDEWVAKVLKVPLAEVRKRTGDAVPMEERRSRVYLINESKLSDKEKRAALEGLGLCQFELEIFVKDHEGQPMTADFLSAFCESKDLDKVSTTGKLERGYYYAKMVGPATGNIVVSVNLINGGKYNKSQPAGNCQYTVKKGKVVLQALQSAIDATESQTSKQDKGYTFGGEFEEEVGGELEIGALKAGGKGVLKRSHGTTTGFAEERSKSLSGKEPGKAFALNQTN